MAVTNVVAGLIVVVSLAMADGALDADLLGQAEGAFQAGTEVRDNRDEARTLFRKAASYYEELRRRGAHNADLYGDQGNAYLLAGDLPRAILAYRRGSRLAPRDPILQANLAHARDQVAYPRPGEFGRPAVDTLPPWLPRPSPSLRLSLCIFCYTFGCLGIVRWWMIRRTWLLGVGLMAFGLALVLAASLGIEEWSDRQESLHPLVVIAGDGVLLRKGNGRLYPQRYDTPLNRGVEARWLFERGDWLQIELGGGQVGWIPRAAALVDEP